MEEGEGGGGQEVEEGEGGLYYVFFHTRVFTGNLAALLYSGGSSSQLSVRLLLLLLFSSLKVRERDIFTNTNPKEADNSHTQVEYWSQLGGDTFCDGFDHIVNMSECTRLGGERCVGRRDKVIVGSRSTHTQTSCLIVN